MTENNTTTILKTCSKCKQDKPIIQFGKRKQSKDGLMSECKACKLIQTSKWRRANNERVNELRRKFYPNKQEKESNRKRAWKQLNKDKVKAQKARRRAKFRAIISDLTTKQWEEIKHAFNYRCAYCGKDANLTQDHIIPISKAGHHTASNVVPSCQTCNSSKGAKLVTISFNQHPYI